MDCGPSSPVSGPTDNKDFFSLGYTALTQKLRGRVTSFPLESVGLGGPGLNSFLPSPGPY